MRTWRGIRYPHTFTKASDDDKCVCNQEREAPIHYGRVTQIS